MFSCRRWSSFCTSACSSTTGVGFYMLELGRATAHARSQGAFEGAMTRTHRIPLNQGICGAAASSGQTVIVDDVSRDPAVSSPVRLRLSPRLSSLSLFMGKVVGELDIDSHFPAAFTSRGSGHYSVLRQAGGKKTGKIRPMKIEVEVRPQTLGLVLTSSLPLVPRPVRHGLAGPPVY